MTNNTSCVIGSGIFGCLLGTASSSERLPLNACDRVWRSTPNHRSSSIDLLAPIATMKSVLKLASDLWAEFPERAIIRLAETNPRIHAPCLNTERKPLLGGFEGSSLNGSPRFSRLMEEIRLLRITEQALSGLAKTWLKQPSRTQTSLAAVPGRLEQFPQAMHAEHA